MSLPKLMIVSIFAFLLPVSAALFMHRDQLQEYLTIDPDTVEGELLYFTAPAG